MGRSNSNNEEVDTVFAPVASNIHISESQRISPQRELQSESEAIYSHIKKSSESKGIMYQNQPEIDLFDQADNVSYAASERPHVDSGFSPDIAQKPGQIRKLQSMIDPVI